VFEGGLDQLMRRNRASSDDTLRIRSDDGAFTFIRVAHRDARRGVTARGEPAASQRGSAASARAPERETVIEDPRLLADVDKAQRIARSGLPVILEGETGTGKEMVARALHAALRPRGPFLALNCSAIPEGLIEAELFGYADGAFTGGRRGGAPGKIERADGGTLLLDEIGDMSLALQSRLLRVLQERTVARIADDREQPVDLLVLSATHHRLDRLVAYGRFREDLYYRLNVIPIDIPPLRERRDDIPILIDHFVEKHRQRTGKRVDRVEPEVIEALQRYDWPGNVRELENTIERAVVLATGPVMTMTAISLVGATSSSASGLPSLRLHQNLEWVEKETIRRALDQSGGVKKDAAELMGISQRALSYYLAKYRID
jgi:transcriptional regulator with PAS, ATPase and Fis domain